MPRTNNSPPTPASNTPPNRADAWFHGMRSRGLIFDAGFPHRIAGEVRNQNDVISLEVVLNAMCILWQAFARNNRRVDQSQRPLAEACFVAG
jgi:hypothetical protein